VGCIEALPIGPAGTEKMPDDWDLIRQAPHFLLESEVPLPTLFPQGIVGVGMPALGRPAAFSPLCPTQADFCTSHSTLPWAVTVVSGPSTWGSAQAVAHHLISTPELDRPDGSLPPDPTAIIRGVCGGGSCGDTWWRWCRTVRSR
jgi:hypothetical protein